MSKKYEAIFIIRQNESEEKIKEIIQRIENIIKEPFCEIFKRENLGLKKLAYKTKGEEKGVFYLINFVVDNDQFDVNNEIKVKINTIEDVLKYLIIQMNQ